jgi:hypothetical protein
MRKIAPICRPDASPGVVGFDHHSDEFNLNEGEVNADLRSRSGVNSQRKSYRDESQV